MTKWELIAFRKTLYKLAGSIGTHAELINDIELVDAYGNLSKAIDCLENYGYDKGWIDIETNEVIEK
jgi:hypothetical protein